MMKMKRQPILQRKGPVIEQCQILFRASRFVAAFTNNGVAQLVMTMTLASIVLTSQTSNDAVVLDVLPARRFST